MKKYVRRVVYLGYYVRRMDWRTLRKFVTHVRARSGRSMASQLLSAVSHSLRFNISILEYYQFGFFERPESEKADWAGTGTMYEYQRAANPPEQRSVLHDKRAFYEVYKEFFRHELYSFSELAAHPELIARLLEENEILVFKDATGNCGTGVSVESVAGLTVSSFLDHMRNDGFDVVETFVEQHAVLSNLSPSGVNTVRVITQISADGIFEFLGSRLRISVDSPIDNLAAGNMAAEIDLESGVVCGPGIYSDITKKAETVHPITGVAIKGLQVPFWAETLSMVKEASLLNPENRSIGWDVVVTAHGPGLIEGNHDWCKLVWQLPVGHGLRHLLCSYD